MPGCQAQARAQPLGWIVCRSLGTWAPGLAPGESAMARVPASGPGGLLWHGHLGAWPGPGCQVPGLLVWSLPWPGHLPEQVCRNRKEIQRIPKISKEF